MRILIADDDHVSRTVLGASVRRLGHQCAFAEDGLSAWRMFSASQPDVLITDWQMPGLDGNQLVSRVRRECVEAYTYVMVLTGQANGGAARASMSAGADDLLRKPLHPEELERKLIVARRLIGMHQGLRRDARSDGLTGLGNRRRLAEDLSGQHARAIRHHQSYGIAIADVDRFKDFNDGAGHLAGDEVLRAIARTLAANVRCGDRVYRYGGEEFVGLLPELTLGGAMGAAARWRAAVEDLAIAHPAGGRVTISVGLAVLRRAEPAPEDVFSRADQALYTAKTMGGNLARVPDSDTARREASMIDSAQRGRRADSRAREPVPSEGK